MRRHKVLARCSKGRPIRLLAYLIGPARAPIGLYIITFDGRCEFCVWTQSIDEILCAAGVGCGTRQPKQLLAYRNDIGGRGGLRAIHLEGRAAATRCAYTVTTCAHFAIRENYTVMSRKFLTALQQRSAWTLYPC